MFQLNGISARRVLLASLLAVTAPVLAQESSILGQRWPGAPDRSEAPGWHAYVTIKDGVEYIQLNDAAGNVRAAIATQDGRFLVLPMGDDAGRVLISPPTAKVTNNSGAGTAVYRDGSVEINAAPDKQGNVQWMVKQAPRTETHSSQIQMACVPSECSIPKMAQ